MLSNSSYLGTLAISSATSLNRFSRRLTLVVPLSAGDAPALSQARTAALELLLSRARATLDPAVDVDLLLCKLFDVLLLDNYDVPVAPITYALDCGATPAGPEAYLLRADPVHVVADRATLRIVEHAGLAIAAAEAQQLTAALNTHFASAGFRFAAPCSHRWYLTAPAATNSLRTHPLAYAAGASMDTCLPFGEGAMAWHQVLNEIQMLLHAHPVNVAREARAELAINSLWLWGGGAMSAMSAMSAMPDLLATRWAQVWSDSPVALGLAKLSNTPRTGAPANAREWLQSAITPGDHLLALAPQTWTSIEHLDEHWIAPLLAAVKEGSLQQITLHLLNGYVYQANAAALKRWWLRRKPLRSFIQTEPT